MSILDQEAAQNFFNRTSELWFNPELERLRLIGSVAEDYQPEAMQVILFPAGGYQVLFDGDMISKEKLQANRKYRDCGYVIFKKDINGNWHGYLNFVYNKGRAKELFDTALQFLETAKESHKARRLRVFIDNLFSATELLIQSMLFTQ